MTTYRYFDPTATGSNTGLDWTNAWSHPDYIRSDSSSLESIAQSDDVAICVKKGTNIQVPAGNYFIFDFGGSSAVNTISLTTHPSDTGATPKFSQSAVTSEWTTPFHYQGLVDIWPGAQYLIIENIWIDRSLGRGIRVNSTNFWADFPGVKINNCIISGAANAALSLWRANGIPTALIEFTNNEIYGNGRAHNWSPYRWEYSNPLNAIQNNHPVMVAASARCSYFRYAGNTMYENYGEGMSCIQQSHHCTIEDNYYYNQRISVYVDGGNNVTIRNNQFHGANESFTTFNQYDGYYWNGGNIVIACEYYDWLQDGRVYNVNIYNNLFHNVRRAITFDPNDAEQTVFDLDNIQIRYNSFINTNALRVYVADRVTYTTNNCIFSSNLMYNASGFPVTTSISFNGLGDSSDFEMVNNANPAGAINYGTGGRVSNNGFIGVAPTWSPILDGTDVPTLFPDASFARLASNSNAIGNAESLCYLYTPDLIGQTRPSGGGCDIGAIEYSSDPGGDVLEITGLNRHIGIYKGTYK